MIGQNIKRLVVSTKVLCRRLLLYKYLYNFIVKYFVPVIQQNYNKSCELTYKIINKNYKL